MATKEPKKTKDLIKEEKRAMALADLPSLKKGWGTITDIATGLGVSRRSIYRPIRAAVKSKQLKRVKLGVVYYFASPACTAAPPTPEQVAKPKKEKAAAKPKKEKAAAKPKKEKAAAKPKEEKAAASKADTLAPPPPPAETAPANLLA